MLYSIWDERNHVYHVYEGPDSGTSLAGASYDGTRGVPGSTITPDAALPRLPPNSTYLGQSETAEGRIAVEKGYTIVNFLLVIAGGILSRYLYDRFIA